MSKKKKGKIDPVEKVKTIEAILSGKLEKQDGSWEFHIDLSWSGVNDIKLMNQPFCLSPLTIRFIPGN